MFVVIVVIVILNINFQVSPVSESVNVDILGRLEQRKNSRNAAVKLKLGAAPVWICDAALRPELGSEGRDSRLFSSSDADNVTE